MSQHYYNITVVNRPSKTWPWTFLSFPSLSLSSALSHFSEGILEYLANLDKAPDPTVRKDTFSSEIYAAYDILFCNWLQSRESKVRHIRRSRKPICTNHIWAQRCLCCRNIMKALPSLSSGHEGWGPHAQLGHPVLSSCGPRQWGVIPGNMWQVYL